MKIMIFITFALVSLIVLAKTQPNEPVPAPVTHQSEIKYKIGEQVKVDPYDSGEWGNGKVTAITSEDEYVVDYCGNYGWANHRKCETKALKRSQMAKATQ